MRNVVQDRISIIKGGGPNQIACVFKMNQNEGMSKQDSKMNCSVENQGQNGEDGFFRTFRDIATGG